MLSNRPSIAVGCRRSSTMGSRESQICIRNAKGEIIAAHTRDSRGTYCHRLGKPGKPNLHSEREREIVEERRHPTAMLGLLLSKREPGARVLLEASSEAFAVAEWAKRVGHEVRVVPATLVRALGVGERGLKNDQRDARKLSEMDCRMDVPSVHIPSAERRDQQARLTAREALVASRTQLVNVVRSYFRTQALPSVRATPKTLGKHVRAQLLNTPEGLPDYIEHLLVALDTLNEQIANADEALKQLADTDPVCKRLQTMPGVATYYRQPVCSQAGGLVPCPEAVITVVLLQLDCEATNVTRRRIFSCALSTHSRVRQGEAAHSSESGKKSLMSEATGHVRPRLPGHFIVADEYEYDRLRRITGATHRVRSA